MRTRIRVSFGGTVLAAAMGLLLGTPIAGIAQGGVNGTVRAADGSAVSGAEVSLVGAGRVGLTTAQGEFRLTNVPQGTYQLRVTMIGYREARMDGVVVPASGDVRVDVQLESLPVSLSGVVVAAGRRAQRITEAPATITRIDASELELAGPGGFGMALKEVKGLDFIQVGAASVAVNARGFNSSFNNRMLMMEDGRLAILPESGLPLGQFTAIPRIDLAGMEVLVGPGTALYGADASNGVITLESKDPRRFPGTSMELVGGTRSFMNVQARHAGVQGDWGYKVTGEMSRVDDFENQLFYTAARLPETGVGGSVDWQNRVTRGQGALVRYFEDDARLELSTGYSITHGVGQTNVGRNQFDGWTYNFFQLKYTSENWFVNAYRNQSQAGDSYALNRFTENRAAPANAGRSDEEIRRISDWPSDGRLLAAEIQNNFALQAIRGTRITWGAQARRDAVSSDRKWLTDRLTGSDVIIAQYGAYAQAETPLTDQLQLVLAGRLDAHDNYDTQFSPKAALVWSPAPDQAIRLSYNRAFKSPTILQTNFWIPNFTPIVGVFHNTSGYSIRNAAGTEVARIDPLRPEENQTYEVGYKGVLGGRLFLDVAAFYADYKDFLSPLTIVASGVTPTIFAPPPTQAVALDGEVRASLLSLTYFNIGEATVRGMDAGATFVVNPKLELTASFSNIALTNTEERTGPALEATALNSPNTKWTFGTRWRDLGPVSARTTLRHVTGYNFRSGINVGRIPTFTTLDAALSMDLPVQGLKLSASLANLFTCAKDEAADERNCGFGEKHVEMINMPAIGSMFSVGLRWDR